jgi:DNA repair protein RecN (Recombination protein N)
MLKSVSISNYALIESLEIEFPEGLIIITGETGAGKSILMGAISLLLGSKAEKDILMDSNKNCVVEASFQIKEQSPLKHIFDSNDLIITEELIIRRIVTPSGRSRSFINDQPVNNKFLKEISGSLVDIHAQHEHLLLSDSGFRLSVLDSFASNKRIKEQYKQSFFLLQRMRAKKEELQKAIEKQEEEFEYNLFQFNRLEEAKLVSGETEELEEIQKILGNAEELKTLLRQINDNLNPSGISMVQILKDTETLYNKAAVNLKAASAMSERMETARIELKELERETSQLAESIESDPKKLKTTEERLSLIYALYNKYKVNSIEELIALKEEYSNKLISTSEIREKALELDEQIKEKTSLLRKDSKELTKSRADASKRFVKEMTSRIRELEMPHAIFDIVIQETDHYTQEGKDKIEFHFSSNKNHSAKEISTIASGGELSRIMLCLKSIMSRENEMPTLIFDEIDSGVSGSIADKMGALIDELSQNLQLFTITHLPQIASKGSCHLLVYKETGGNGKSTTKIKKIEEEERIMEIARMLSGSKLTEAAIANAREFLKPVPNN